MTIPLKGDFITEMFTTDFTVQFNSVDVMTSSIILHSDWSVVSQLSNAINMEVGSVGQFSPSV